MWEQFSSLFLLLAAAVVLRHREKGKRGPEMHHTKKGKQYYFGAKPYIGVDDDSGLVHSVLVTAASVADVTQVDKLLHGGENVVCADPDYTGVDTREE